MITMAHTKIQISFHLDKCNFKLTLLYKNDSNDSTIAMGQVKHKQIKK